METNNMTGGPGEYDPNDPLGELTALKSQSNNQAQLNQAQAATVVTPVFTPVYVGGRKFESADELAAYTESLYTENHFSKLQNQPSPAVQNANRPKPGELIYQDPDAFYEMAVEDAEARVMKKLSDKEGKKTIFDNFYAKNRDLSDHRDLVDMFITKKKEEYKNLPAEQGMDKIALEVRSYISKLRGSNLSGKELPSAPAVVAGASNGTAATAPVQMVPQNFVDQMKRFQKRGR